MDNNDETWLTDILFRAALINQYEYDAETMDDIWYTYVWKSIACN